MIGDIKNIKKLDIQKGKNLLSSILKLSDKSVIGIQGGSGTKKSEL